jgi:hypothetical protein
MRSEGCQRRASLTAPAGPGGLTNQLITEIRTSFGSVSRPVSNAESEARGRDARHWTRRSRVPSAVRGTGTVDGVAW